jgi:hypothetical protein
MSNFNGNCYAADTLAELVSAAPEGLFVEDPISGETRATVGQIMETQGWLVEPVYTTNEETGETEVVTPGTPPPAVCLLTPANQPVPALSELRIEPFGWQGFA